MRTKSQNQLSEREALRLMDGNRKGLRKRGIHSSVLDTVHCYFSEKLKRPRLTLADVARMRGVSATWVAEMMRRAEAAGLVVRVGRTFLLFAGFLLKLVPEFARERTAHFAERAYKRLELMTKSRFANPVPAHTEGKISEPLLRLEIPDRATALAELRVSYVPVHLRKG